LVDKGWVEKVKRGKSPTGYSAVIEPDDVRENQLNRVVETMSPGSVVPLVAHLVQGASLTSDELSELKKLIREAEQRFKQEQGSKD
jgi:predicted transcriptional regulator